MSIFKRFMAFIGLVLFISSMAVIFYVVYVRYQWKEPLNSKLTKRHEFIIKSGMNLKKVARLLEKEGLLSNSMEFEFLVRYKNKQKSIKAGEYKLAPSMNMYEILNVLTHGRVIMHSFTIPEGLRIKEMLPRIQKAGFCSGNEFYDLVADKDIISRTGLEIHDLEGYLFPETYTFAKGVSCREIVQTMVDSFTQNFTPKMKQRAKELGMTINQVVTLASIIEKETANPSERPKISSVFHNRLKRGMLLQTDPTVIYGIENFNGNITRADLRRDHPYNTYTRKGLPPGPIASPGLASIKAALYPASTAYLYFVSMNNGRHYFSKNLIEHNKAVQKYQIRGKKGK